MPEYSLCLRKDFFHLLPFLAIVKDILIVGIGVMVLMMIPSKPLPGLPTVGSPPLPLVTHNLAILDGPARFHLHRHHHHDDWLVMTIFTWNR